MVHLGHDIFQKLNLINVVSLFLFTIIFFILQYIFDMEFVCSCQRDLHQDGYVYFIVPPVILTWVVYVTEPFHQARIFSVFQSITDNKIVWFCVELFLNYLSVGALWIASILFDGDWYVCLKTNRNGNQTGIPCKKDLTHEEYKIKAGYKTESLDLGLVLIGSLIIVWSVAEIITAFCNRKRTWRRGCGSDKLLPPYYRKVYEGLLEEQVSVHLKEKLTEIARERAEAICEPHLSIIEQDEQPPHNRGDGRNRVNNTVLEAWQKISAWDFPFSSD